ncbi:MAG: hypothetical protein FWC68_02985 [Oscillospiraceae bacterium]|nr:hypothetical protein [Oscillospiraceae bacterium]
MLLSVDPHIEKVLLQTTTNQRHFTVNGNLILGNGVSPNGNNETVTTYHGGVIVNNNASLLMQPRKCHSKQSFWK